MYGGAGEDELKGNSGNDLIYGGGGDDFLYGDCRDYDFSICEYYHVHDEHSGGIDTIYGGDGNDLIVGGVGADDLSGGAGADIFAFEGHHDFGDIIGILTVLTDCFLTKPYLHLVMKLIRISVLTLDLNKRDPIHRFL